jgi:predicted RNase H-like HicB family nuclease
MAERFSRHRQASRTGADDPTLEGEAREMAYRISVVIEKDRHGYYAFSPEIEGCQTQGASFDAVIGQVSVMIKQYIEPADESASLKLPA